MVKAKYEIEGSEVLEKLAAIGKVEEFFEAVDSDDFAKAKVLMKRAHVDQETRAEVLRQMAGDNEFEE